MNNKFKKTFLFLLTAYGLLLTASSTQAVCPVCTVAVGAGVGLTRYLGIEDTIAGVWIGGLIMSLSFWTIDYFNRKDWRFKGRKIMIVLAYYLLTIVPLYSMGVMGHPMNKLCGMDKLLLGSLVGSAGFIIGVASHYYFKKKNNDQSYFPFQKVVCSIVPLIILSGVFYVISKC